MFRNKKAFTFVELIVSITIIVVLSTIGFSSYTDYISDSRDSQRKSDLAQVSSSLKVYKQKRGYYGNPGSPFNIQFSGSTVALQGKLDTDVRMNSLEKLPLDPDNEVPYSYSITNSKQEFELAATLENGDFPMAHLSGNYKSVSSHILPTITLASNAKPGDDVEIGSGSVDGAENRKLFVYDKSRNNLVYTFEDNFEAYSNDTEFVIEQQIAINNNAFWQNSDFRNCVEINEAGKLLIPATSDGVEYQIINDNGKLDDILCDDTNSQ